MTNGSQDLMYEHTAKQVDLRSRVAEQGCLRAPGAAGSGAIPCNLRRYN